MMKLHRINMSHEFRSSLSSSKFRSSESVQKIKDPLYIKLSIFSVRAGKRFYGFIIFVPEIVHYTVTIILRIPFIV